MAIFGLIFGSGNRRWGCSSIFGAEKRRWGRLPISVSKNEDGGSWISFEGRKWEGFFDLRAPKIVNDGRSSFFGTGKSKTPPSSKNFPIFEEPPPPSKNPPIFEKNLPHIFAGLPPNFEERPPSSIFGDKERRNPPSSIFGAEERRAPLIFNLRSSAPKNEEPPHLRSSAAKNGSKIRLKTAGDFFEEGERFFEDRGFFDLPAPKNEDPPRPRSSAPEERRISFHVKILRPEEIRTPFFLPLRTPAPCQPTFAGSPEGRSSNKSSTWPCLHYLICWFAVLHNTIHR